MRLYNGALTALCLWSKTHGSAAKLKRLWNDTDWQCRELFKGVVR